VSEPRQPEERPGQPGQPEEQPDTPPPPGGPLRDDAPAGPMTAGGPKRAEDTSTDTEGQ
jgi:hypothetical protein